MLSVLPVRRSAFNAPACPAAPAAFVVLVRRGAGDAALRGEHAGDLASARRHARTVCQAVADRFEQPATAEVLDAAGVSCFRCEAAAPTGVAQPTEGGSR